MIPIMSLHPALARTEFIGRVGPLGEIETYSVGIAGSDNSMVVFLTGTGGIGKTEMLKEILQRYATGKDGWRIAASVVDLYHPDIRTKFGLAEEIVNVLSHPDDSTFAEYRSNRARYQRGLLSASGSRIKAHADEMEKEFRQGLTSLATQGPVMIALDTAEKLVYPPSEPEQPAQVDELWSWLCEMLGELHNIVLLVAGRPQIQTLVHEAKKIDSLTVHLVDLPPFTLEESKAYLDAIRDRLASHDRRDEANRLTGVDPTIVENAHHYTGGEPISLALFADLLAAGGPLPDQLFHPPAPAQSPGELRKVLHQSFVEGLLQRPTLGQILTGLSYLPRGATPELLAQVLTALSDEEWTATEAEAGLNTVDYFSIVKIPQNARRVFLHDEIYTMLYKVFELSPGAEPVNERVQEAIKKYYGDAIRTAQQELNQAAQVLQSESTPSDAAIDTIVMVNQERRRLLVEALYYRLRQDPDHGFRRGYRYMREAILAGDVIQDRELQLTMLEYLAEHEPTPSHELIQELATSRSLPRMWAEGNYTDTIKMAEELRKERSGRDSVQGAVTDVWDALGRIILGGKDNTDKAKQLLDQAIYYLEQTCPEEGDRQQQLDSPTWRSCAVLAFALRVRGYWQRSRGRMRASLPDYLRAIQKLRQINFQVELAVALNDYGFASAELGMVDDGRAAVEDALLLRVSLASWSGIAYSTNTLAVIDVIEGKYDDAAKHAEQARNIFQSLGIYRGEGLSELALAEAWRRRHNPETLSIPNLLEEGLNEALTHAERARSIFDSMNEQLHLAQALVEIGCTYRDLILVMHARNVAQSIIDDYTLKSESALRNAVGIAEAVGPRWQIDAYVNMAWLGSYAKRHALLEEAYGRVRELLKANSLEDYFVNEASGKPRISKEQAESWVWGQIGKMHVVRAEQFMERFLSSRIQDRDGDAGDLKQAIRHYAIGLENSRYGLDEGSRDLKRVKTHIHNRIRNLRPRELAMVPGILDEFEETFHLSSPGSYIRELLQRRTLL